jgi:hypothetical protein
MADKIKVTVLEDGTIKCDTDKISMPNHSNAEGFLRQMFSLAGGVIKRVMKGGAAAHHHHTHEGHEHSHDHGHEHHQH